MFFVFPKMTKHCASSSQHFFLCHGCPKFKSKFLFHFQVSLFGLLSQIFIYFFFKCQKKIVPEIRTLFRCLRPRGVWHYQPSFYYFLFFFFWTNGFIYSRCVRERERGTFTSSTFSLYLSSWVSTEIDCAPSETLVGVDRLSSLPSVATTTITATNFIDKERKREETWKMPPVCSKCKK